MVKTEVKIMTQALAIERIACQSYKKGIIYGSRGEEGWLTVPRLFPKQVRTFSQIMDSILAWGFMLTSEDTCLKTDPG